MANELEPVAEQAVIRVPVIGELVHASEVGELAPALAAVRSAVAQLREAEAELTEAIRGIASVSGSKTLRLDDGTTLTIKGGTETTYDAEAVEQELRDAGMPEERISEIVVGTTTYQVKAVELKRAAGANPVYREIMERHATTREKRPYVGVELPPPGRV